MHDLSKERSVGSRGDELPEQLSSVTPGSLGDDTKRFYNR